MNLRHQSGIALIMTLLFSFILSLLVLTAMGQMMLRSKESSQLMLKQQLFYHAESVLRQLYRQLRAEQLRECQDEPRGVNFFFDVDASIKACSSRANDYNDSYLIENMGIVGCFSRMDESSVTLVHYRINLISESHQSKIGLQSNVLLSKNNPQVPCHGGDPRAINEDVLSWREIHWS